ncbi:MAG TPA: hypothetical protein VI685_24995 [Candidatus Angelobacter sp.]
MNYYISPPEKTNWSMSPSEFVANLVKRWPNARVRTTNNPEFSPAWEIQMRNGILDGRFYPPLPGVVFSSGDEEHLVTFVLWFRSLVPPEQPLLFYQEGFGMHVEVKPDTTVKEILAALNEE